MGKRKYISFKDGKSVGKTTFETTSQLRTSIVNVEERKLYILDLIRATGNYNNIDNVPLVFEKLKNGYLVTNIYGSYKELLCEPPHVITNTTVDLDYDKLSEDR